MMYESTTHTFNYSPFDKYRNTWKRKSERDCKVHRDAVKSYHLVKSKFTILKRKQVFAIRKIVNTKA